MYFNLLPPDITKEIYNYLYFPVDTDASHHRYYSLIRFNSDIIIRLHRIINYELDSSFTAILINDKEIFTSIPENINNYYSWAAIQTKKYLKHNKIKGKYKCVFVYGGKDRASIVINCDTNTDLDAMVFIL
jgi:hypothetical protein